MFVRPGIIWWYSGNPSRKGVAANAATPKEVLLVLHDVLLICQVFHAQGSEQYLPLLIAIGTP